jgi:hypothetical protein
MSLVRFVPIQLGCATLFLLHWGAAVATAEQPYQPRSLMRIPPGTVIGREVPQGWTNLVLFVNPRLGSGDFNEVSGTVSSYTKMFKLVILANTVKTNRDGQDKYHVDKLAVGFAMQIGPRYVVVSADTQEKLGGGLSIIGQSVLSKNDEMLKEVRMVTSAPTFKVFDADALMLRGNQHKQMVMRHSVWCSSTTGQLGTMVWLLDHNGQGAYKLAENNLQYLPNHYVEDRVMNVKKDRFTFGVPSPDAFALVRIPQGRTIPVSPELQTVAAAKQFTPTSTRQLALALNAALQQPQQSTQAPQTAPATTTQ